LRGFRRVVAMLLFQIFECLAEGLLELLRGAQGRILAGGLHEMEQFRFNGVEVEDLLDLLRHGRARREQRRGFILAHGRQLLRFIEFRGTDIRVEADGVGDSVFHILFNGGDAVATSNGADAVATSNGADAVVTLSG
jgi:hypothetical protein